MVRTLCEGYDFSCTTWKSQRCSELSKSIENDWTWYLKSYVGLFHVVQTLKWSHSKCIQWRKGIFYRFYCAARALHVEELTLIHICLSVMDLTMLFHVSWLGQTAYIIHYHGLETSNSLKYNLAKIHNLAVYTTRKSNLSTSLLCYDPNFFTQCREMLSEQNDASSISKFGVEGTEEPCTTF